MLANVQICHEIDVLLDIEEVMIKMAKSKYFDWLKIEAFLRENTPGSPNTVVYENHLSRNY